MNEHNILYKILDCAPDLLKTGSPSEIRPATTRKTEVLEPYCPDRIIFIIIFFFQQGMVFLSKHLYRKENLSWSTGVSCFHLTLIPLIQPTFTTFSTRRKSIGKKLHVIKNDTY